jgi:DNA-binding NarL/FixJ family response regulator
MTDGEPLRVVIAEDSVLMREGIASLLEGAGFEIVGKSSTADDLLLKVRSYKPHVAIVDIRMPPNHTDEGLVAAKEIREQHPEVGVLVLSQYVEPSYAMELIADDAEGVGYLLKDRIPDVGRVPELRSPRRRGRVGARPGDRHAARRAGGAATTRSRR